MNVVLSILKSYCSFVLLCFKIHIKHKIIKNCPLKKGCYKEGAKSKMYSISIKSEIHQEQIDFEKSTYFKEKSKHRYKIEAKNGELKNVHGYGRAISYGIENMQMQGALTIFAVNLKRIVKLT